MPGENDWLEYVWDGLLSRDPVRVCSTYEMLDEISKQNVLEHLKVMVTEDGWHPGQVESALAALKALDAEGKSSKA